MPLGSVAVFVTRFRVLILERGIPHCVAVQLIMSASDQGYTVLLSHLHNPATKLALSTIQGALSYHLANISPLPTPLAALTVSSPFYLSQPFTYPKLHSLCTAFRHAIHLKYRAFVESHKNRSAMRSVFGRTIRTALGQWVTEVLKGLQGGHAVLRLASCTGLLLGIEDVKVGGSDLSGIDLGNARFGVEDEIVVSVAEVMDAYAYGFGSSSSNDIEEWEKEFQPAGQGKFDFLFKLLIFLITMFRYSFFGINTGVPVFTTCPST